MSETAIITAASLIAAGLVCLGAAAENLSNLWLVSLKKLVKSLPTCWFA